MHFLLANSFFFPAAGGIENYILNLGRSLVTGGHEVTVVTRRFDKDLAAEQKYEGMSIIRYPYEEAGGIARILNPVRELRATKRAIKSVLLKSKIDFTIARDVCSIYGASNYIGPESLLYIQATAYPLYEKTKSAGQPGGYPGRVARAAEFNLRNILFGKVEKNLLNQLGRVVVLSTAKKNEIAEFYKVPSRVFTVIPPGVDTDFYKPVSPDAKIALRRRLRLPEPSFIYLYVGRGTREKNPIGLLRAYSKLVPKGHVALVMVGPTDQLLRSAEGTESIPPDIIFPGITLEPVNYYQAADAFVLPSLSEGFGQVLLEAMACELPCIGYSCPKGCHNLANEEVIRSGETGLLAKFDDDTSLSAKMMEIRDLGAVGSKMGSVGRRICCEQYRWSQVVGRIIEFARKPRAPSHAD